MQDVTRLSFERYTSTSQKYIQAQAQAHARYTSTSPES